MKSLVIIISMFLAVNVTANSRMNSQDYSVLNIDYVNLENELFDLEQIVFEDALSLEDELKVSDIVVNEEEEEININFDTKEYLPERFNPYKGMHNIDWNTIELVEIEEEIDLGITTKNALPKINTKSNSEAIIVGRF